MAAAATRLAARVLQTFAKLVRRDLERGRQAKEDAGNHRRQQGEGKCTSIDPNALQKRKVECIEMRQPARASHGQKEAERGATTREGHALGEHLAQQPKTP